MRIRNVVVVGVALLALGNAQAELFDRGGGLIYDSNLDVTWLQDANFAKTSGYDADGLMTWNQANTWAASLVFGGHDDWRLPSFHLEQGYSTPAWSPGSAVFLGAEISPNGGELNRLFSELGGELGNGFPSGTPTAPYLFTNVQPIIFWTSQEYSLDTSGAWLFAYGGNGIASKIGYVFGTWAVRDGDVVSASAPVPEPETYAMMLAGLGLLGLARRWKQSA